MKKKSGYYVFKGFIDGIWWKDADHFGKQQPIADMLVSGLMNQN